MFVINEPHTIYKDPWSIPFSYRFKSLCSGLHHVAYFYEHPDTSTFRYRVYNMIQVLTSLETDYGASFFGLNDIQEINKIVDAADLIVIGRTRYTMQINQMITRAKLQGKRVIFDVDDLVFDLRYTDMVMRTLDQDIYASEPYDYWFSYFGRLGATLKLCDGAITTNDYLAQRIREFIEIPVSVIPNFLNEEQLSISDRIFEEKINSSFARNHYIDIGYFSGSPTHNHDFALAAKALAALMRKDKRVRLMIVGFLDIKDELREFRDRITFYPLHDFINLQRVISLTEINIVPLVNNTFTNCKSELKYFEAAAVGTATVASPIYTYSNSITHGVNGYLAKDSDWSSVLDEMIDGIDNYSEMAFKAHKHAIDKYAWFNQLPVIKNVLNVTGNN